MMTADAGIMDEERLWELIEVGRRLVAELDQEVIMSAALEAACRLTGARRAALVVLDGNRAGPRRTIGHGVEAAAEAEAITALPRGPGALRVPIVIHGRAWGSFHLTDNPAGGFELADEQAARILAEWTAIAVANAGVHTDVSRQRDSLGRAVRSLEAMTEVTRAVGGETDLDRILATIARRGLALVEARSLLILLDEDGERRVAAAAGEVDDRSEAPELAVPLVFRGQVLGALVARDPVGAEGGFGAESELLLGSFATSAATAVATARTAAAESAREGIEAAEGERGRWARELHDESLQTMAGLRALLSAARRNEDPAAVDRLLGQAVVQVDAAIADMRRLIADLRPATLDELGLGAALEALGERLRWADVLSVSFRIELAAERDGGPVRFAAPIESTVYRLIQEALNNVAKHAGVGGATVEVVEAGDEIRVLVEDGGRGFDVDATPVGFGLTGMRERVELSGGSLVVRSLPGEGTSIAAVLPARRLAAHGG
jgi:signal transduction histidine kinase